MEDPEKLRTTRSAVQKQDAESMKGKLDKDRPRGGKHPETWTRSNLMGRIGERLDKDVRRRQKKGYIDLNKFSKSFRGADGISEGTIRQVKVHLQRDPETDGIDRAKNVSAYVTDVSKLNTDTHNLACDLRNPLPASDVTYLEYLQKIDKGETWTPEENAARDGSEPSKKRKGGTYKPDLLKEERRKRHKSCLPDNLRDVPKTVPVRELQDKIKDNFVYAIPEDYVAEVQDKIVPGERRYVASIGESSDKILLLMNETGFREHGDEEEQ
ncbi:MAG: hypothetical protein H7Y30_14525 [Pyrinomonadaceae bacterium]|nr:hypothetical protein [Pyrinomonadaceae bacterium]